METELKLVQEVYELVVAFLVNYSFQLFGAFLILLAGYVVAGLVSKAVLKLQEKQNVDVTLRQFIAAIVRIIVIGMFVIIALDKLGISINPFIAALGGLAVGASFALQGPVSNYGAGLMIILARLYKVGDTITIQGCFGQVEEITLSNTVLVAEDGERIIIPNKHVVGEIHRNSEANRILEGSVYISYTSSPEEATKLIYGVLASTEGLDSDLKPQVGINKLGEATIEIGYRVWIPT
ncbi:MAG: mechanosensitive ion channel domain-containing protein [Pseudomonadales bacterium]